MSKQKTTVATVEPTLRIARPGYRLGRPQEKFDGEVRLQPHDFYAYFSDWLLQTYEDEIAAIRVSRRALHHLRDSPHSDDFSRAATRFALATIQLPELEELDYFIARGAGRDVDGVDDILDDVERECDPETLRRWWEVFLDKENHRVDWDACEYSFEQVMGD